MKHLSRKTGTALLSGALAVLLIANSPLVLTTRAGGKKFWAEDSQARVRELWEEAVAAKSGRDRLSRISSLYVAAGQGHGARQSGLYVFPYYAFDYSYDPGRERSDINVRNVRRGISWWQLNGNPAKLIKPDDEDAYLIILPQIVYLIISKELNPVPLRSRKAWLGLKRVDVVEVDAKGWLVDYYLDPKTHLPIKVVLPFGPRARSNGEMDQDVLLEDYAEIDGVMMPRRVSDSYTTSPLKWTERLTFEINPKYDPTIFEQPPTAKMGPEAWRLKKANITGLNGTHSRCSTTTECA
jgi:hypothetical protein